MTTEKTAIPCTISHPNPRNPALSPQNPPRFVPTFHPHATLGPRSRCRMDRERFDAGGRECPRSGAQTSAWPAGGGGGQRGSAGGRRLLSTCKASHRAGVPFPAFRAGAGHRCGPVADMARMRQGPCRNTRPKQLPRPVQAAAGATRVQGPEEGQVDKPTFT
jgi:hypothetical protein